MIVQIRSFPVARILFSPLLNPLGVERAFKVIFVVWFLEPFSLAGGLARLATPRGFAVFLAVAVAVIRIEKSFAMTTSYSLYQSHSVAPPK
jgi:hypothetical protein